MFDIAKYFEAATIEETIKLLQENPNAKIICGGTDVLIKSYGGNLPDAELVSIKHLKEIQGISLEEDGTIVIGAGTSFTNISNDPIIKKNIPVLGEAVDQVGGPQVRNTGTIGGNICNGATSADSASTLLALNAKLKIQGNDGIRMVALGDFYEGPGKVHLAHGEILTAILITAENYAGYAGHYIKYAMRKAMDIATLGTAVVLKLKDDKIADFRLAFGVAGPTPRRCPKTEALAIGKEFSEDLLQAIGHSAVSETNPRSSWRASKEFRQQLIKENSMRACQKAYLKAGGKSLCR